MSKVNLVSNKLLKKLIAASSSDLVSTVEDSKVLNNKDLIPMPIAAMNIMLSGMIDGGLIPGMIQIAGPSKHFKTLYMLIMMKAYMDKYPESVGYLFDSEFGAAKTYFNSLGIDASRVVHNPITSIEHLKHESSTLLETIERGDKVFIGIDSVGNLASKKEIEDAINNKSVVDMTRAKALKSFGRIVTPHLTIKDVPMVLVNHSYQTLEMFSTTQVSGGTGLYYSSNEIWLIGRSQEKSTKTADKGKLLGYNFSIISEKSRTVKEKSKISVYVDFEKGIDKYSGLLEIAVDAGFITGDGKTGFDVKSKAGETHYKDETALAPVFEKLLVNEEFKEYIKNKYRLAEINLLNTVNVAIEDDE